MEATQAGAFENGATYILIQCCKWTDGEGIVNVAVVARLYHIGFFHLKLIKPVQTSHSVITEIFRDDM